ncbi:MAG: phosphoglycolate phosphatase [Candidatus Polarisedimenticolaceae bacterium]|nr:phosphoglycolate phosphatase [Candidatus Polarisedimenticolaceae bacterium]
MKSIRLILIDLDGTLIDSVLDLTFSIDKMLHQLGRPPAGEANVRNWVGNGVQSLVSRALTGEMDGQPDKALFERAFPLFMAIYAENTARHSTIYPGVREGLDRLKEAGYLLGCITNKAGAFTEPLLKKMGLFDDFEIIISGDTLAEKKPHPLPLLYAAEKFSVRPEDSIMIGDSINDIKAARAAGFKAVAVTYGYNHGQDIRDTNPDIVIDSINELPELL